MLLVNGPRITRVINSHYANGADKNKSTMSSVERADYRRVYRCASIIVRINICLRSGAVARLSRMAQLLLFESSLTVGLLLRSSDSVATCSIEFGNAPTKSPTMGTTEGHSYSGRGIPKSLQIFRTSCFLISRCRGTVLVEPVFEFL